MTWLDERLFGWSRRSGITNSLWGDSESEPSRHSTPEVSEDEAGDYDDVFGMVHRYEGIPNLRNRGSKNSYADLQHLRHSSTGELAFAEDLGSTVVSTESIETFPGSPSTTDPLYDTSPRPLHRERRSSLSENISVERISQINRRSTFEKATDEINNEVSKHSEKATSV